MYQSHLKSSSSILTKNVNNKTATLGQIRERQIKEGSLWSKSYENIHSNANISTSLPLKPLHQNNTNINMNTIPDKEAIIIALQLEVDRLKTKVNNIIKTSEDTIIEFTLNHDDIKNQYTNEYNELLKNYNDMTNDRDKYKNIAMNLSKDIQNEQDNLRQTMKYINNDSKPSSPLKASSSSLKASSSSSSSSSLSLTPKKDNIEEYDIQIRNYIKLEAIAKAETVAVLSLLNDLINDTDSNTNNNNINDAINNRKEEILNKNNDNHNNDDDVCDSNITINYDVNSTSTLNVRVDHDLLYMWKKYDSNVSFNDFFNNVNNKLKEIKERTINTLANNNSIIENLQKEKDTLDNDNKKANDVIRDQNERLLKLQTATSDSNKLKQENDDLKEQLKEIANNYEESHSICMKLEQELMSLTAVEQEYQQFKNSNSDISKTLELQISKAEALEEKVLSLQQSNADYHDEIQKLIKLKDVNDNITKSTAKLNEKIKSVVDQYESEKSKCKSLEDDLRKANYDHDMMSTLLSAMEERNAKLDKQLEIITTTNNALSNDNNLKHDEILSLRKQFEVIESKHKNASSRVVALEASLVELSTEFRSLTEKDCNKFHSTLQEYETRLETTAVDRESLITSLNEVTKERDESLALQSALSQLTEEMEYKINQLEHDKRVLSDANNNTCALNDELQKTTTDFLTVATSSIKELEDKLQLVEEERDQLLQQIASNSINNDETVVDNIIQQDFEISSNTPAIQVCDITIPFQPTEIESSTGQCFMQSISAMDEYSSYSFEELRYFSLLTHK